MCCESNCWWNLLIHSTIYSECEMLFHLKIFVFFYISNMRVHHEKSRLNPQRQCLSQHFHEIDQIWCLKAFFLLISVCCANAKIKSMLFFYCFVLCFYEFVSCTCLMLCSIAIASVYLSTFGATELFIGIGLIMFTK